MSRYPKGKTSRRRAGATNIYFDKDTTALLRALVRQERTTKAEVVRRALRVYGETKGLRPQPETRAPKPDADAEAAPDASLSEAPADGFFCALDVTRMQRKSSEAARDAA